MEEKKPTDEEIAKAILQQVEYNAGIPYINEWKQVKTIKFTEILDFIHRLQAEKEEQRKIIEYQDGLQDKVDEQKAEIERLTRELDDTVSMNEMYIKEVEQNAELQKQVDELTDKLGKVLSGIKMDELLVAKGIKQAVKDTAKEILDDLRNIFIEQSSYGSDANQHIGYYDYEVKMGLVIEQIEEYAKEKYGIEYGVEVE